MRERDIERYLVKVVKLAGGEVRKVKWIGRRAAPDRLVMHPTLGCWVELKAPGKKVTAEQEREHARMRAMGEVVRVFNGLHQIERWIWEVA